MRRTNNQDSITAVITDDVPTWATRGHFLMVADGMGAHAAGELASKIAVDNVSHSYFKLRDLYPPAALRQAIREANAAIHSKGQSSIGFQGMGTTCSSLVLLPQGALVAHIGDSRVYRLHKGVLEQLTFDHSLVWEMAAAGHIAEEDVPSCIPKNVITRSLGPHPSVQVDIEGPYPAEAGDTFLLCSDGLSGQIKDEELGVLLQCLPPEEAAKTLVDLANLRGGPDNISVIVAHLEGDLPAELHSVSATSASVPIAKKHASASLWLATGAFMGLLIYCLARQLWLGAGLAGVGLAAAIMAILMLRAKQNGLGYPAIRPIGGPYGNGPYRKTVCTPNQTVVSELEAIAKSIRALPDREPGDWTIDWKPFDEQCAAGSQAAADGDFTLAVRRYSQAIREIMQSVRAHRPTIDGDERAI